MKTKTQLTEPLWVAGIHPVAAALEANQPPPLELVTCRGDARVQPLLDLAARRRVPVRRLAQDALSRLCGCDHHQGVALRVGDFPYADFAAALAREVQALDPLVVLDCLQDPQNLGAILRSACFFGAAGALIPKDRSAAVTAAVIKIAAGATAALPVFRATNLARTLDELKAAGLWVVGLDLEGPQSLYDLDLTMPLALVVGNEQRGLRRLIRDRCDLLANIPGSGKIQSLNAANAAAVALAEILRQRRSGGSARP